MAYILQQNGFPAGAAELTDKPGALAALRMIPQSGPSPPRSGALVQAVGCLQKNAATQWILDREHGSSGDDAGSADAGRQTGVVCRIAGHETIELISVYPGRGSLQNTVLVKGLFVSRPAGMRINVTSMELIHLKCGQ